MIFAETNRLILRALTREDLPRYTRLIGEWDVTQWLSRVPYPFTLKDAEKFLRHMEEGYRADRPELFLIANKASDAAMGGVGLHPSNTQERLPEEVEIGYWLGRAYWGQGYMSEAVAAVLALAFRRPEIERVISTTDPANEASQNVLRRAGLTYVGLRPRVGEALRGGVEVTRWELTRVVYERNERRKGAL